MSSKKISTRFLITSDTLNFGANKSYTKEDIRHLVPKVDVLLHSGNLTMLGGLTAYKKGLEILSHIDAELKLIIAGDHDVSLDGVYWKTQGGVAEAWVDWDPEEHSQAMDIMTGSLAKQAGVTYLEEGIHRFTLKSGAAFTIYASPYHASFRSRAFAYNCVQDPFNDSAQTAPGSTSIARTPIPDFSGVDIVMTHGPPRGILDESYDGDMGCENLLRAVRRARPLLHCFGHLREGYGMKKIKWTREEAAEIEHLDDEMTFPHAQRCSVIRGEETLMVNGSLRDQRNQPNNLPWIVDLDLPVGS
ncbi:hypothetical protein HYFRA_00007025 [Hymenoscyphus fraxineus]|uniref:Metallo-dependent phosphatase n=1 Tax=Hymenoscyphus fraxineus TaxID=746836 RepID=A0A9N9PTX9_9HELO|nr:hypothetical protein HYFRA_00007025 [Hymenoscyphus fraxineus]